MEYVCVCVCVCVRFWPGFVFFIFSRWFIGFKVVHHFEKKGLEGLERCGNSLVTTTTSTHQLGGKGLRSRERESKRVRGV